MGYRPAGNLIVCIILCLLTSVSSFSIPSVVPVLGPDLKFINFSLTDTGRYNYPITNSGTNKMFKTEIEVTETQVDKLHVLGRTDHRLSDGVPYDGTYPLRLKFSIWYVCSYFSEFILKLNGTMVLAVSNFFVDSIVNLKSSRGAYMDECACAA
jgi:hypothetical protein